MSTTIVKRSDNDGKCGDESFQIDCHLNDPADGVGTPETKRKNKTIEVSAEKTPVEESGDHAGLKAEGEKTGEFKADVEALWEELWQSDGQESDIADRNGERLYPIVMNLRGGHYGKMYNCGSPFPKLAAEPKCPVGEKQLRRIFDRWTCVLQFREMGVQPPRLGVAHYDASKLVKDPQNRLAVLQLAASLRLNVSETHEEAIKASGRVKVDEKSQPKIPMWRVALRRVVGNSARSIASIHEEMTKSGGCLDEDDLILIDELKSGLGRLLATLEKAA